ncbi:MAG: ketoacyl-ACP synthase III [Gemmatimonadetes bacterium]|nr:ketoacyl-ACP synthase III [Gemmatimonadota bacterium]
MKRPIVELAGTGRYVPERVLTNADFERMVDTSDQWIIERTGIRERHIASAEETIACMATSACRQVLEAAGVGVEEVDSLVVGTASPDRFLPSQACDIQKVLGANNAAAFDVGAACSGFLYGLNVAEGLIAAGTGKNVLVVGAERLSKITDYEDRTTCILFGDGAGATLVRPSSDGKRGILGNYQKTDGRLGDLLYRSSGGANEPPSEEMLKGRGYFIHMAGRETFKSAVRSMADACDQALSRAGLTGDQVDLLIPHQANMRIIEATAKHAGLPMDRVYVNIDRYGNTSAASIPIALDECVRSGRITAGSIVLMVAFGGGFTWASVVVRW